MNTIVVLLIIVFSVCLVAVVMMAELGLISLGRLDRTPGKDSRGSDAKMAQPLSAASRDKAWAFPRTSAAERSEFIDVEFHEVDEAQSPR